MISGLIYNNYSEKERYENLIDKFNKLKYLIQTGKNKLPTHIEIESKNNGLKADSVVLTEQIRTIDKSRLKEKIGHIDDSIIMNKINNALGVSFGL